MPPSTRFKRAAREGAPRDLILDAVEIQHTSAPSPIRLVNDRVSHTIEGHDYLAVAFRMRVVDDRESAPRAELAIDNVGRPVLSWIHETSGAAGATVRLMNVLVAGAARIVEWEVTLDALSTVVTAREVVMRLGFDPLLGRPAMALRYDPDTAPGLF